MLCSAEENFNPLTLLFKSSVYDLVASDGGVKIPTGWASVVSPSAKNT